MTGAVALSVAHDDLGFSVTAQGLHHRHRLLPEVRPGAAAGTVSLDAPALTAELGRPGGRAEVRAVMMHEIGHLLGLGPGDRRGLAALGAGHCVP